MKKYSVIPVVFLIVTLLLGGGIVLATNAGKVEDTTPLLVKDIVPTEIVKKEEVLPKTPQSYILPQKEFVGQTFNNCGPAALSMTYSLLGIFVSQAELAERLRPFNNPAGGVDDKSVFPEEFIEEAQERGFLAMQGPNGATELLEQLIAQDIPVIVRTWLNPIEDIGHFRVVRGYDREAQIFTVDDSYNGPNLQMSYAEFDSLWQPFNYSYIVVYPKEKKEIVERIIGEDMDPNIAWANALKRAEEESASSINAYPAFNIVTAKYHLGDYKGAVEAYEKISSNLPPRMFWYQLEPLRAYLALGNYEKVFEMTDSVLMNGNQAFSELYEMRGDAYKAQGNTIAAQAEYDKAILYNKNLAKKIQNIN